MGSNWLIHLAKDIFFSRFISSFWVLIFEFFDHIEVVGEFVEFLLAQRSAQIDHKRDRYGVEYVCVQIFTELLHAVNQQILCRDQLVIFEVIHEVFLTMFA